MSRGWLLKEEWGQVRGLNLLNYDPSCADHLFGAPPHTNHKTDQKVTSASLNSRAAQADISMQMQLQHRVWHKNRTIWTKSGIALLYNEETNNTYDVCLKLTKEVLTIQKLDVVCTSGSESQVNGGAEHNVPVVISKIFKDQVHLLRTAGDEVTITVRYLREVPSFLKLPLGKIPVVIMASNEPKYEKRWLDAVCLPLLMARVSRYKAGTDKLRSNYFEVFTLDGASTNILQFCTAAESTDWLQAISTNINDLAQENGLHSRQSFNVHILFYLFANHCNNSQDEIPTCAKKPFQANNEIVTSLQIVHMGWACESSESSAPGEASSFKFLALRGPYFYIFRSPPISGTDWGQAETTYNLYEVLFKVHKLWMAEDCWLQARLYLGLEHSPEQQDSESLCFSILVGHGQSHTFRVELATDLATWEKSFQRAVFFEVQRIRMFMTGASVDLKHSNCDHQHAVVACCHYFGSGFTCAEGTSKTILWRYKFSQLKGSSDDGKTRVKLLFKNAESKQIEMKELEFANLTAVLHCIHSFIAAKVASMDPLFMCSQSFPGNYVNS
ncbi:Gamma-2-syntrophin [Channa argus]|uniref:Gamma-2-syntrophin n=1 Tax=Channa argus TaxID=215402 RepID=A0A6G1QG78_CHAAH|nr:Gamma-2-syntrophin [Channa argus]